VPIVQADSALLEQLLGNLLANARQYRGGAGFAAVLAVHESIE